MEMINYVLQDMIEILALAVVAKNTKSAVENFHFIGSFEEERASAK